MVGIRRKQTAVAKICAIDSLPGEELASRWSSRGSRGRLLAGTAAGPRRASDAQRQGHTALVGQSLKHNLAALRIAHAKIVDTAIVDTAIVASEATFGEPVKKFSCFSGLPAPARSCSA
ncbi:hypothetical protein DL766_008223 [Monosporascus sp. MC13-8B]|nr:hypothetical protein DL766_008223 [Monosporascus sp. MC13-8B]